MSHPTIADNIAAQTNGQYEREYVESHTQSMRIRINHSHTLKEGWRLSETTVEFSGTPPTIGEYVEWVGTIQVALQEAHSIGEAEARRRRIADGAE